MSLGVGRTTGLYVVQLALLATHQVDAAFWHEWDVFGVPGGLPLFLGFNLIAVGVLALGLAIVASSAPRARTFQIACALTGIVTVGLHAVFLVREPTAFATVSSLAILAALALGSPLQLVWALRR